MKKEQTLKSNPQWFDILSVIVKTNKSLKNIRPSNIRITKLLRNIYFLIIIFFYTSSFVFLVFNESQFDNKPWLKNMMAFIDVAIFFIAIIDYILWLIVSVDINKPIRSIIRFVFSGRSILLLLVIVPSLHILGVLGWVKNSSMFTPLRFWSFLRLSRLLMLLVIFTPFEILFSVFKKERYALFYTFIFILIVIVIFALIFYNIESKQMMINGHKEVIFIPRPESDGTFKSVSSENQFLKALYFTTVTMTTIGFGDLTPQTELGRIMVIVLSLIGIALFAIPSGIIAGAFIQQLKDRVEDYSKIEENMLKSKFQKFKGAMSSSPKTQSNSQKNESSKNNIKDNKK